MPSSTAAPALHPLAPLTGDEITAAREIVFASGRAEVPNELLRFAYIGLFEPPKEMVRAVDAGEDVAVDRRLRIVLLQGPEADVVEAIVSVTRGEIDRWEIVRDVRPPLQMEESIMVLAALHDHPEWNAALDRRGVVDRSLVQIDPWPAGTFGLGHEEGRRITRCLAYLRDVKEDNGYARPLEGLIAFVDMGRAEVLEVLDTGVVPFPSEHGSYYPEHNGPLRTDLKPLEITQPEGPSFEVDGNLVRWQKWSLRIGMDPLEGLVLWTVGYEDGGRIRPIVYRASVSEMVVPYGHPGPMHAWKSAFDAGEWGLGRMANSLTLGCDCLGEIRYFDDVFADERGKPHTRANAICMHEEDYGILWKHVDMVSGRSEVRRSRRLVVSSIATVGNYEYGFYWYFYLDGSMQLEVKLTGIMSTMAVVDGDAGDHARMIAPGLAAPFHQHLFNVRLDMQVDGPDNEVYEVDAVPTGAPGSLENPWGNAFGTTVTLLESELEARRDVDASRSRTWRIANPSRRNSVGEATAYKLLPGCHADVTGRPEFECRASRRLRVAQSVGHAVRSRGAKGCGRLPQPAPRARRLADLDGAGSSDRRHRHRAVALLRRHPYPAAGGLACHAGRVHGLHAPAVGFFDRNPALDVPPSSDHCHD